MLFSGVLHGHKIIMVFYQFYYLMEFFVSISSFCNNYSSHLTAGIQSVNTVNVVTLYLF